MDLTQPIAGEKRRPRAEIQQLVAEFQSSGMPAIEFCRSRGLSRSTLYCHLKRQPSKANADSVSADAQLVRVELTEVNRNMANNSGGLVVGLASGRKIEVAGGFDGFTLERLVSVLEQL